MILVVSVAWLIAGIVTVAKVVAAHDTDENHCDGPVMNFLDKIHDNFNETFFVGSLIGIIILAITLWPLVLIYQFIAYTKLPKKEMSN